MLEILKTVNGQFENLSIIDKNDIITTISTELNIAYSEVTEQHILDYHKQLKIEKFRVMCENKIESGFTASNGRTYRTNRDDQINMIGQKDELRDDETVQELYWKTEDSGYVKHSRDEWLTVYSEGFTHKKSLLLAYDNLKTKVLNAKTHLDILEIDW